MYVFWPTLYIEKVDSVYYIAAQSNANMSWIFLEIPPGNLKICSVKFVDTLLLNSTYKFMTLSSCLVCEL